MRTLKDLGEYYDLDLEKAVELIGKSKRVLLQFPDGLKQYALGVVDFLEEKTDAEFFIWFDSCFGACDAPVGLENLNIDLVIQFGHNEMMPGYLKN